MLRFSSERAVPASVRKRLQGRLDLAAGLRERVTAARSRLEVLAERVIGEAGLPSPVREHHFIPGRDFRFDLAWPAERIAIEVQGGTWTGGRHVRGTGYEIDCRKMTAGQVLGWTVLYATERMLRRGDTVAALRGLFGMLAPAAAVAEIFPPHKVDGRRRQGEAKALVLAALDGGPTVSEAAHLTGISMYHVSPLLRRMLFDGDVQRTGTRGGYRYWRAGEAPCQP